MHHYARTAEGTHKTYIRHMAEHDGNIKYEKYTGEIQYDGVKAPDSYVTVVHTDIK